MFADCFKKSGIIQLVFISVILLSGCTESRNVNPGEEVAIISKALEDSTSVYYANFNNYPADLKSLPVGMFDSGTGGLTVLEQFLVIDSFNNTTGVEYPDGVPDFDGEEFIYLADQANMPYGVYSSQNKTDYLRELIIKDALFLTTGSKRTKVVVIACNTATAFGLEDVSRMLQFSSTGVKAIGVIDAGVEGAMSRISHDEKSFAVGVLATVGTIASGGYERSIIKYSKQMGYTGDIRVVNQGGAGFAEAVDSEVDYISKNATEVRENYRGPRFGDSIGIQRALLSLYNFDTTGNSLLVKRDKNGDIEDIQLNSSGNYARFHMVSLLERHRLENPGVVMKSIILGCTHYPYLEDTLREVIAELRDYSQGDIKPYESILDAEILFIDPAVNTAKETFKLLFAQNLLKRESSGNRVDAFISVPHNDLPKEAKDSSGNLTFNFKYGRDTGSEVPSVTVTPFSKANINRDNLTRIEQRLPLSYSLLKNNIE
jgi:glutamate racemase